MPIVHHPDDATLMSYAAGGLGEALSAVVATHASMCPRCRTELRTLELMGGVVFDRLHRAPLTCQPPPLPERREEAEYVVAARTGDVPAPLQTVVGLDLDAVPWRRIGIGVWHFPLPLSGGAKGDLRLLKVAPGQAMPEHGHGGTELTLMLRGSYRDEVGVFRRGDLAELDEDVEHRPVASVEEGCVCLIASEERARFKGLMARLVQPLTGF